MEIKKLKKLRKDRNLTVKEMANKLGICKSYYSQIENGNRKLYYDLAVQISAIFNLKPDDIFYDKDIKYQKRS